MSGLQDPERFSFYLHQVDITQYGALRREDTKRAVRSCDQMVVCSLDADIMYKATLSAERRG